MKKVHKVLIITDDSELKKTLEFCLDGWGYEVFFDSSPAPNLSRAVNISPDVIVVDAKSATDDSLGICDVLKRDYATSRVPLITIISKRHLRHKLLNLNRGVDDYLINPPDPLELRIRIEMAIRRSQHSFYANPLTGLPGGMVIEDTLKERLEGKEPFVAGQVDIDNFKSFNDKYGYLQGDRVIMQTAYMLNMAIKKWGNKDDFIGHIGGDDFVIVTSPEKYNELCRNFICMFDTIIPFHYSLEDRKRGYIVAKDRANKTRKISMMSVTIALVMKNSTEEINNIIQLNERTAEVKEYLKKIPGSKYMADRRVQKKNDYLQVQVFKNDETIKKRYSPLGQILLAEDVITPEQLDKALKMQWKRGELLGQVLKDLEYVSDEKLSEALKKQEETLESSQKRTG